MAHRSSVAESLRKLSKQDIRDEREAATWLNLSGHTPIIRYIAKEPLRALATLKGTIIPLVLSRGDFWFLCGLHLVRHYYKQTSQIHTWYP